MTEREKNYLIWKQDGGPAKTITFQGIDESSCVFDIGLYKGNWAEQICSRYNPTFYGFEPVQGYFKEAKKRLSRFSSKIKLFNHGVGGFTRFEDIVMKGDSTSIFLPGDHKQRISIKSIKEVLEDVNVELIDLTEINIEGGEYELLESMISTGLIERFKQLLIQFHRLGLDWANRRSKIREALSRTHTSLYNYEYVWELWTKKRC